LIKAVRSGLVVLGVLLSLGFVIDGVDRLSSLYFGPRAREAYAVVDTLHVGMSRESVGAILQRTNGRLIQNRERPELLHFVVSYTIIEACAFTMEFTDGALLKATSGDMNQPGPCPDAR
jgi:hypothetical protein